MAIEAHAEVMEAYVLKAGHKDRAAPAILHDLLVTMAELDAAELEIARLKRQISAGFVRRDISHHYEPGWSPKKPLPTCVTDEWISTGQGAAL
jgi:hypothetical protein